MGRRFHLTLVLSMVIGVLSGLGVAGFDGVVQPAIEGLADQPLLVVALVPAAGLVVVNLLTQVWRDGDTAKTDAYVRAYHERGGGLSLSSLWRKTLASASTLGSGNALGFEGPSMMIGARSGRSSTGGLRRTFAAMTPRC